MIKISPVLYGATSAHTVQLLNEEELATGLGRFWVSQALTTRIQNCEMIMETSVVGVERNCEDVVNMSSVTFNGWIDQENPPKGWKAATSKKGEMKHVDDYKANLQETDAIFTWDLSGSARSRTMVLSPLLPTSRQLTASLISKLLNRTRVTFVKLMISRLTQRILALVPSIIQRKLLGKNLRKLWTMLREL